MRDTDKDLQKFYNDISKQFADEWYSNDSLLPVLKSFVSLLNSNARVLDFGCGAGYESMRLHNLGVEVVGIDYSIEPIKIAREKNPQCRFEVMDFRRIDKSIGSFDGIVAIASIIHVDDNDLIDVFKCMSDVIKPNGYIMIIVIEGSGLSKELSKIENNGIVYNRPFYLHSKERLTESAENAMFELYNETQLCNELGKFGWKCFIFKSKG